MNKEEILTKILEWEQEAGEDFTDYFGINIITPNYMFWCLAKEYITKDQFNLWEKDYSNKKLESDDPNYYIYNNESKHSKIPYAIVSSDEWNEKDYYKAYSILAEFISQSITYQIKLKEFLEDN